MPKSFREVSTEILSQLDILAEYRALGVKFPGNMSPRSSGMVSCFAFGREDRNPSAWVNIQTGYYGDSGAASVGSGNYTLSLWDFAAAHGGFESWQEARKAYAAKAGVHIPASGAKREERWRDRLEFLPWSMPGLDMLTKYWCMKRKKGVTPEALLASGARAAYYPCYRDKKTGEQKRLKGYLTVIALPAYGDFLLAGDPVSWVIWDITGADMEVPQPKDHQGPKQTAKMLSIGETRGAMMGLSGLIALSDDEQRAKIEIAWKSGGPSDMLAIDSAIRADVAAGKIPAGSRVVITNASGEMGDVLNSQARLFFGIPKTIIIGDADTAGVLGTKKWAEVLRRTGVSTGVCTLPYAVREKHGLDARDFLNGVPDSPVSEGV